MDSFHVLTTSTWPRLSPATSKGWTEGSPVTARRWLLTPLDPYLGLAGVSHAGVGHDEDDVPHLPFVTLLYFLILITSALGHLLGLTFQRPTLFSSDQKLIPFVGHPHLLYPHNLSSAE